MNVPRRPDYTLASNGSWTQLYLIAFMVELLNVNMDISFSCLFLRHFLVKLYLSVIVSLLSWGTALNFFNSFICNNVRVCME